MSPDEILADLRDIHLPAAEAETLAGGFNFWPLIIVSVLLSSIMIFRLRRKGAARRELRRAVFQFADAPSQGGMTELLALRQRAVLMGVSVPDLPRSCFLAERANDNEALSEAARALRRAVER